MSQNQIYSLDIMDPDVIEYLNEKLADKGYRIEKGETLDPYTDYWVYQDEKKVFRTIYPDELAIKVAQLLPESEVRKHTYTFTVGGKEMYQDTLVLDLAPEPSDFSE